MNTTENNKLIAEFIGATIVEADIYLNGDEYTKYDLKYHSDWNWLMEVVQKINNQNNVVQIHENHVMVVNNTKGEVIVDIVSGSMLEAIYEAVVEYIKLKK